MTTRVSDYDYNLPDGLIAHHPAEPRDAARLLVAPAAGNITTTDHFYDLTKHLKAGDLLVLNNTRVIPARLFAQRRGGGAVEVLLHRCLGMPTTWSAFCRPAKKLKTGSAIYFEGGIEAVVTGRHDEEVLLQFNLPDADFWAFLERAGQMPLPPYIARPTGPGERDKERYQTVYAQTPGAVAAPTAGLHFTPGLQKQLVEMGVGFAYVTLHVGAGTFQPVRVEDVAEHKMHAEWGLLSAETASRINATRQNGGRVICVGTTSLRLVESAARSGTVTPWEGDTDIFITPGFTFNGADGLMTNFHLPRSTLLMLVAAFVGYGRMQQIYQTAIAENFRFYSYGDSSLLWRAT